MQKVYLRSKSLERHLAQLSQAMTLSTIQRVGEMANGSVIFDDNSTKGL
jgi:hypothetical protein